MYCFSESKLFTVLSTVVYLLGLLKPENLDFLEACEFFEFYLSVLPNIVDIPDLMDICDWSRDKMEGSSLSLNYLNSLTGSISLPYSFW